MPAKQNNMFFYKITMKQNAMKIQSHNEKKTYLVLFCYVFKYFLYKRRDKTM